MKEKNKPGWYPKWVRNAYEEAIWYARKDFGALRPNPVKDPKETNRERVARQRAERKKRQADEKALKELKEKV